MSKAIAKNLAASAPELSTLLLCGQTAPNAITLNKLRSNVKEVRDWSDVVKKADRHGMAPMLHWNLSSYCHETVSEASLEDRFKNNALNNLMRTQELLRVLRLFEEAEIRAIPYKGPVLAASIYKNLALREFFDLDILIHQEDVSRATGLLSAEGYDCETRLNDKELGAYLGSGCELGFCRNGIVLELHWQVAPRTFSLPFAFDDLWSRRQMLSLAGSTVSSLSTEDMLLVLCVHAAKHSWNSLCWIVDIAELLRMPTIDWRSTTDRARTMGAERILQLGILLAHELFSAQIPEAIKSWLVEDGHAWSLTAGVMTKLRSPKADPEFSLSDHLFFVRSRERWSDKLNYIFRTMFTPDLADWRSIRLPPLWSPLYRLIRIYRLAKKFVPKMLPRANGLESAK